MTKECFYLVRVFDTDKHICYFGGKVGSKYILTNKGGAKKYLSAKVAQKNVELAKQNIKNCVHADYIKVPIIEDSNC